MFKQFKLRSSRVKLVGGPFDGHLRKPPPRGHSKEGIAKEVVPGSDEWSLYNYDRHTKTFQYHSTVKCKMEDLPKELDKVLKC